MKILIAEDEIPMAEGISDILNYSGYITEQVYNGSDALSYAESQDFDAIILDIMMPEKSGLEVLQELRDKNINTPVLLLTAKSQLEDKVKGLDLGADDYLTKPFAMEELLARLKAIMRRGKNYKANTLTYNDISLDTDTFQLTCNNKSVSLSKLEYNLMETLIINQNIYLSSEKLLEKIWGANTESEIGTLWVYISYLRKHLNSINSKVKIAARRNIGYKLEA